MLPILQHSSLSSDLISCCFLLILVHVIMAASLLWTAVFVFLLLEIGLTMILVAPVPRKIRTFICRQISKLNPKQHLHIPLICIGFGLALTLLDSLSLLQLIFEEERETHDIDSYQHHHEHGGGEQQEMFRHLEKEKEYRTERNIYLSGFALTLIFVIGRITDLMQEHVELEDNLEKLRLSSKPPIESVTEGAGVEIEMKTIPKKPSEKKND